MIGVAYLSIAFSIISGEETFPGEEKPYEQDSSWYTYRTLGRRGRKMKTSTVGLVLAAILMVVAGVGFGIAQAGGNDSDESALCCVDQEALEQGTSSIPYTEDRPVLSFGDEMQL